MGWLKEDDVKPLKRLFKQRNTEGSLMGRGFNPPDKYQGGGYMPKKYSMGGFLESLGTSNVATGLKNLGGLMSPVGGFLTGLGGYQQGKSNQKALDLAISRAGQVPGMIDRMYQPGMERTQDLYDMYNPRGGQMFKSLQQNLGSVFNQNIGQVDPAMRKMLSRGNVAKASQAMQSMIPQFTQAQVGLSGQLANMEQGMGQAQIGAHENLAQLQAARKAINPSAQALGSFGASLMSMVQGGGKVKKQGGENSKSIDYYNIKDKKAVDRAKKADVRGIMKSTLDKDLEDYLYKTTNPLFLDQRTGSVGKDGSFYIPSSNTLDDYTDKRLEGYQAEDNIMEIVHAISDANLRKKEIDERLNRESQARKDFTKRVLGVENPVDALKAGGGYISGPHHGAGGVDMGNNVEAQGGEFVMNANAYNKNPSIIEALNMNDNEMTVMNGFFGDKHSAHGNSLNMQGGGELNTDEMSNYQKYLVVRGNKPSEFKDEADFNKKLDRHNQLNDPDYYEGESMTPLDSTWRNIEALTTSQVDGSKERVGDLSNQAWFINKHILPLLMENPPKVKQDGGNIDTSGINPEVLQKFYNQYQIGTPFIGKNKERQYSPDYTEGSGISPQMLDSLVSRYNPRYESQSQVPLKDEGLERQLDMLGLFKEMPEYDKTYDKQQGGGIMNEGTMINKIIKKTYGM